MPKSVAVRGVTHVTKRLASKACKAKANAYEIMRIFDKCVANTTCPLPTIICKGHGVHLYDIQGREYLDFISGYGSMNLGHCHPKINKALFDQAKSLAQSSREVYTKALTDYAHYITNLFCYEKVLPMNSGTEAAETAVKLARKWGYKCKKICPNLAKIIVAENNNWGKSIAGVSASTDPAIYSGYGPFVPGFDCVPFSDMEALEYKIVDPNVCAFMVEPVQCEAGVVIPDPCYLKQVRELCTRNRVLFIADEIHTGLGRCGSLLCCDIYRIRPDVVVLGKALAGGCMPVSAVLADSEIMDCIEPGSHGSTFGGNALGCHLAMAFLKILQEEKLIENSRDMGEILRGCLCDLPRDIICEVRGLGLLNAIVLKQGINAWDVCTDLLNHGLLVKPTNKQVIRLCPPLTIKQKTICKAAHIIRHCIENSRGTCDGGPPTCTPSDQNMRGKLAKLSKMIRSSRCADRAVAINNKYPNPLANPLHSQFITTINNYTDS